MRQRIRTTALVGALVIGGPALAGCGSSGADAAASSSTSTAGDAAAATGAPSGASSGASTGVGNSGGSNAAGRGAWRAKLTSCAEVGAAFADLIQGLIAKAEQQPDQLYCDWVSDDLGTNHAVGGLSVQIHGNGTGSLMSAKNGELLAMMNVIEVKHPEANNRGFFVGQMEAKNDTGAILSRNVTISIPITSDVEGDSIMVNVAIPKDNAPVDKLVTAMLTFTTKD